MVEKKFDKDVLRRYLFEENNFIPKEAMGLLARLLYDELNKYCDQCEDDRMTCVLAPMCPERILLKVRLQAGANIDDLPKFCYQQYKNNIRRFLEKRTTLYKPIDNILFNEDFFEIFFPKISKKLNNAYDKKDIDLINLIIEESDLPEVRIDFPLTDNFIFRKIIQHNKLIKADTFVYHIPLSRNYMIIWFDGDLYILDFKNGKTICNAKNDPILDLNLIGLVFDIYCAEKEIDGQYVIDEENKEEIAIEIRIPFDQVYPNNKDEDKTINFHELLEFLQHFFLKIKIEHEEEPNNELIVSLIYSNIQIILERKGLSRLSYDTIKELIENINKLKKFKDE